MRSAKVEGVEWVEGPGGIVRRRPGRAWDGGIAGFGHEGENVDLLKNERSGEGASAFLHFLPAVCTELLGLANFLQYLGYRNLVPDILSCFSRRRQTVGV